MSFRKISALVLLVLWIGALLWQARRLYLRPEAERLAAAARTLPPGVAYYRVERGGHRVGWAQSEIDTLPDASGFRLSDRIVVELGALGASLGDSSADAGAPRGGRRSGAAAEVRSEAEVGPTLALRWFRATSTGLLGGLSARGEVVGDSLLVLSALDSAGTPGRADTVRIDGPIVFENAIPLRFAAEQQAEPGDSVLIRTFDPIRMSSRTVALHILDRATRTFPDSAALDTVTGRWEVAGRDTVQAWKVGRDVGGVSFTSWIDEDGRFLEAEVGGLKLLRTAFELAYYGSGAAGGEAPRDMAAPGGGPEAPAGGAPRRAAPDSTSKGGGDGP